MFSFFFQAEDGIRDYKVTGVQTCALPISCGRNSAARRRHPKVLWHARTRCRTYGRRSPTCRPIARSQIGRASCRERGEAEGGEDVFKQKRSKQEKREEA